MKKVLWFGLIILTCFFACFGSYKAEDNGTSSNADDSGGTQGTKNQNICTGGKGVICSPHTTQRIMVSLVYYDGRNTTTLAGKSLIKPYDNPANRSEQDLDFKWYKFINNTSSWSWEFYSNKFEEDTVGSNEDTTKEERRKKLQEFIDKMNQRDPGKGWNINLDDLDKKSCEVNRKGNCFGEAGYRLIAELYVGVVGDTKEISKVNFKSVKEGDLKWGSYYNNGYGKTASTAMRLVWSDINYYCKGTTGGEKICNNGDKDYDFKCLTDKNCSYGVWIVDITGALKQPYDYSLDAACVNCDTSGATSASYVIQDIDNWEALMKIGELSNENNKKIKDYFTKGVSGHICREQYQIFFPNSLKTSVERGKYFTINESAGVPNFKPFSIERVIQCKKTDGSKGDLSALKNAYCKTNSGDAGKMMILYNELGVGGYLPYTLDETEMRKVDSECKTAYDGDVAMITISSNYKLPEDTYRYIKNGTNQPVRDVPAGADLLKDYTDINVPNLPVHLNHKVDERTVGGYISVKFELPEDSTMQKAYNEGNGFFKIDGQGLSSSTNIYSLWKEDKSALEQDSSNVSTIKNSACAKLFGYGTEDFEKCANARSGEVKNKISACKEQNKAVDSTKIESKDKGYTCEFYMDPDDDTNDNQCSIISTEEGKYTDENGEYITKEEFIASDCCDVDNHDSLGVDWNLKENVCCPANTVYNTATEKCEGDVTGDDCTKDNHTAKGLDWNAKENRCCPSGTVYNESTGKCESDDDGICTIENVGTGKYANYLWGEIMDDNGQGVYGCCPISNYVNGKCYGGKLCVDGVNGTYGGDAKLCKPEGGKPQCEKSGNSYYIDGSEVSKNTYATECCNSNNYSELDRSWNSEGGYCCLEGEEYNETTKTCAPKSACSECSDASLCCESGNKYYCGTKDKNGNLICSGKIRGGTEDLVFRNISLTAPFVGEAGEARYTGVNWAYRSADGTDVNRKSDNNLVTTVISDDVYNKDSALYTIKLDAKTIDKIRSYNRDQKSSGGYSDFTLDCKNGNNCKSGFLREIISDSVSGICMGSSDTNEFKKYCS